MTRTRGRLGGLAHRERDSDEERSHLTRSGSPLVDLGRPKRSAPGTRLHRQPLADAALPHDPLEGIFARSKRGFYHDGRYPTLMSVVEHYNSCHDLNLTVREKTDLVQYLHSR